MLSRIRPLRIFMVMFLLVLAGQFASPPPSGANSACSIVYGASPFFDGYEPECLPGGEDNCYECIYSGNGNSGYSYCAETPDGGVSLCSFVLDIQQVPF